MNITPVPAARALALVVVLLTGCAGERSSAAEIAYQARIPDADRIGVMTIRADGSDHRFSLGDVPSGLQRHADWSPTGTELVFTASDDEGTDDLWLANADGTRARKVVDCTAPCLGVDEAAWSPDGTKIVYTRLVQPADVLTSTLEMLDVRTGTTAVVTTADSRTVLLAPRWSPRGDRLVVEWLQLDGTEYDADPTGDIIGVIDLADVAAGVQPLTDAERFANNPDWSGVHDEIVYAARVGDGSTFQDLYLSAPDGSATRRLTHLADAGELAVQPTFTPDGRAVLFVRQSGRAFTPTLMRVDLESGAVEPAAGSEPVEGEHPRMRPES